MMCKVWTSKLSSVFCIFYNSAFLSIAIHWCKLLLLWHLVNCEKQKVKPTESIENPPVMGHKLGLLTHWAELLKTHYDIVDDSEKRNCWLSPELRHRAWGYGHHLKFCSRVFKVFISYGGGERGGLMFWPWFSWGLG